MNPYIQLPKVPMLRGRQDFVIEKCSGKRVLHLGCVDSGLLEKRFETHTLTHQKMSAVAAELWGVDIDEAGIKFLSERGFEHLYSGDVSTLEELPELQGQVFDIIVATEIVEHLQNPGLFLNSIKPFMVPGKTEFVISVPNAYRIETLLWLLRGVEYVHPDHNYWFSYLTITNLLRKNNYDIRELYVYASFTEKGIIPGPLKNREGSSKSNEKSARTRSSVTFPQRVYQYLISLPKRALSTFLFSRTPFWGDGIIVVSFLSDTSTI